MVRKCTFYCQKELKLKINKLFFYVVLPIFAAVLLVDLLTKSFIADQLNGETVSAIPNIFNFTYVQNYGAAWSIFSGSKAFLIIISILFLILLAVFYVLENKRGPLFQIGIGLLLGGAMGNLIDRISLGYVRDFIQFDFWKSFPVFNIADAAITIGVVVLALHFLIAIFKGDKNEKKV